MNGALSKGIKNDSKVSKNTGLSYGVIFLEGDEVNGCWNKLRGHMGPTRQGVRPGGRARPPPSWPGACPSCCVLSARYSQKF